MAIAKALKVLLIAQLVMMLVALWILFTSNLPGAADLSGLAVLFPLGIFAVLGLVNIVLLIVYIIQLRIRHQQFDRTVGILIVLVIISVPVFYSIEYWLTIRSLQNPV